MAKKKRVLEFKEETFDYELASALKTPGDSQKHYGISREALLLLHEALKAMIYGKSVDFEFDADTVKELKSVTVLVDGIKLKQTFAPQRKITYKLRLRAA